jgi:hypothetical protein
MVKEPRHPTDLTFELEWQRARQLIAQSRGGAHARALRAIAISEATSKD